MRYALAGRRGSEPHRLHLFEGAARLPETAAPNTKNRSHSIKVAVDNDTGKAEGVLLAASGGSAAYSIYILDGKPVCHYNFFEKDRLNVVSSKPLPKGKSTIELAFAYDGGGLGKGGEAVLLLDGEEVGRGPHRTDRRRPVRDRYFRSRRA